MMSDGRHRRRPAFVLWHRKDLYYPLCSSILEHHYFTVPEITLSYLLYQVIHSVLCGSPSESVHVLYQSLRSRTPRVSHPLPCETYRRVPSGSNSSESESALSQSPCCFSACRSRISPRIFNTRNVPEHGIRGMSKMPSMEPISRGWRMEIVIFISQPLLL